MEVTQLPYSFRPKNARRTLGAVVGALAVGFISVPAAQAACAPTPTTKAFAAFGDTSDYSLASGGSFETGTAGWTLSGASVVNGNESFKVHGPADAKSLAITPKGNAASAPFCVAQQHPTFRLFAKRTSGTWGVLNVKLRWTDEASAVHETVVGAVTAGDTAWHPTVAFNLAPVLGIWNSSQSLTARIVLDPEDAGGAWAVDDVYVDPYSRT
jgi:hypothetical protein